MRALVLGLAVLLMVAMAPAVAVSQGLIPERRLTYLPDADLPGGDFANQRDTTIEACATACTTDRRCEAFTFNSRFGACFLKAGPGPSAFYAGAMSGRVLTASPQATARAAVRREELGFLGDGDMSRAAGLARGLGADHPTGEIAAEDHLASAATARAAGNRIAAADAAGRALAVTDAAAGWLDYADDLLAVAALAGNDAGRARDRAALAAINAYLRAENPALRHTILVTLGAALEQTGRGRDQVQALRLAQAIAPRDDTAVALDAAIAKYGFRIAEHSVQSDSAEPRLCASFTEDLLKAGVDYSSFVQLAEPGLSVAAAGDRQLCVEGLTHGQRISATFRAGLPAADGQTLAQPVTITAYVRDRTPSVRFPGRGYLLPRGAGAAIPVETVNATDLTLTLYAVSDRNLLRAIQGDFFGQPMEYWREDDFAGRVGEAIWKGSATVPVEVNRDMTTRLPLAEALTGRPAGIYALKAAVAGRDEYSDAPSWQWFVVSDLGMTSFLGADGLTVAVRSLGTAAPRAGVTVELLSRANAVLASATTDDQGVARIEAGLTRGTGGAAPAMLIARAGGDDLAFLSLTDPEFDLSDRGVAGRDPAPPVDVFLTTERGAYRPGDTVHATALARDSRAEAIAGLPLTAVWKRPDGVEHARAAVADVAGGYVFSQVIAAQAPRGTWRLELLADTAAPPLASRTFLVEDFLPERIDFDLAVGDAPLRPGEPAEVTVTARYLFGPPGADLAVEGEVLLRAAEGLAAWPGYRFGRHDEPFSPLMDPMGGGIRTDEAGVAVVDVDLPQVDNPGRPLEARFTLRVAEGSGRPVERQVLQAVAPAGDLVGIRPLFDDVVPEGGDARFALVVLGPDLTAKPARVEWELTRIETRYQWYQDYGSWYWEPVTRRTRIARGTADAGTAPVEVGAPVTWGQYELVATALGSGASSSTTFWAGWYAPADVTSTPDTLELSLDKPAYLPGETAMLRIVPRAAGTALVSVLSNRVVALQSVQVAEGENLIPLPVTEDWGAGVYVTASVIRPMDVAAGRNPARALGLAHAAIDPGQRRLATTIETAPEADPRGPLDVAVRVEGVAPGDTAHITVAAVDVGILNLTAFTPPDPAGHYFGQRKLGVGLRDVYGRLIDGLTGAEGQVRSGGDGGLQARLQADPPTEDLVAYFSGPIQVGPDGLARVSFDLPAFNGTVRVMAVAWSGKGIGQASADVLVRDPVVVTASLPRFLAPGDDSRLLLEVVHATGPAGRMGLDVTAAGLTLGPVPSGLDLAPQGKAVLSVPLRAGGTEGVEEVAVALTTPEGRVLTRSLRLTVRRLDPEVARISRFDLPPGATFAFDQTVLEGLDTGGAKATLAMGSIARLNAPGLLAALDRYPYGCTEQITSRALPLLYYDLVAQALNLEGAGELRARVGQAVEAVLLNQTSEGGFGLWRAEGGDFWLDAYVTDFLSRARAQGIVVPQPAFRAALDNLRNQVNYTPDFDAGGEALAYALMVLAREGAAAIGDLRYYADVKADAFATPMAQAQLGAALAFYGDQARADALFRKAAARIDMRPEREQLFRADYGTNLRDAAAVLTLATEAGSQAVDREGLVSAMTGRTNLSTQESVWMLLAVNALREAPGADGLLIDGAPASGPLVRVLPGPGVRVENTSARPQMLTVTAYGVPVEPEPEGGNGYAIARSHYTLDGAAVDLSQPVPAGTRLVTVIEVTPFGRGEARLMVTDPLPAGFEIDNPNLITGGQIAALEWLDTAEVENAEFRQDRFVAALDRRGNAPFRLAYVVRAVSPGQFHHPAASVEDMYRPDFRARGATGRVTVAE
ncbi:MAG TPA: alpha-2-macroglobulin family protein [Paracoccaceae bacterium]|nr:alpha-2-macroglobulin family protein [Paracoccaceae bacterium]